VSQCPDDETDLVDQPKYMVQPHTACHSRHDGAKPGECEMCGCPTWSDRTDEFVRRLIPDIKMVCNHCIGRVPWPPFPRVTSVYELMTALAAHNARWN
jgi:hypothetical protein